MNELPIDDEEELSPEEARSAMSFLDHLEELRWTLFKCGGVFLVAVVLVGIFLKAASGFLNWPYERAMAAQGIESGALFMTSPMGVFSVLIQVCFMGGLGLSLPFMLAFIARFLAPALKKEEIGMLLPACLAAFVLFLGGAAFSYLFIVPEALQFSIRLNEMLGFEIIWSADRYYGLLVWTVLGMGFCFQFPLIVYVLVYLQVVTTEKLAKTRRYMIVLFFFLGALLTPTWDPVTQALVALPMWALFEISLVFARKTEKRRAEALEREIAEYEAGAD